MAATTRETEIKAVWADGRAADQSAVSKGLEPLRREELILSVNARWRRMRVLRRQDPPVGAAVAETVIRLEARGWRV